MSWQVHLLQEELEKIPPPSFATGDALFYLRRHAAGLSARMELNVQVQFFKRLETASAVPLPLFR